MAEKHDPCRNASMIHALPFWAWIWTLFLLAMTKTEGILNEEILSNEEREILGFADLQPAASSNSNCH